MTKRYFYDCPIKALYMIKNFAVICELNEQYLKEKTDGHFMPLSDILSLKKIYVAPESESIFDPKEGDTAIAENKRYGKMAARVRKDRDISFSFPGEEFFSENFEIIMRDSKHFFSPEIEECHPG
jgi:hypothetical protein